MEEKIFLESKNISVSNSRFIVGGQTYAMSNVTSVKTGVDKASKVPGISVGVIGLFVLFGVESILWGSIILIVGILLFILAKNTYSVVLCTASGENEALISKDRVHIESVIVALNESVVSRG